MKKCTSCNKELTSKKDRHLICSICRDIKKQRECTLCYKIFIGKRNKCTTCKANIDRKDGYSLLASIESKRRAKKKLAIPKFANLEKIKEIYHNCPEGYQVDHIIPLNNNYVCGLHIEFNLQYLKAEDNLLKSNKFDFTYNNQTWKGG